MNAIDTFTTELLALMARHGVRLDAAPQYDGAERPAGTTFAFVAGDESSIEVGELNSLPTPDPGQGGALEFGEAVHTCGQPGTYSGRCPDCDPY